MFFPTMDAEGEGLDAVKLAKAPHLSKLLLTVPKRYLYSGTCC